MPNNVISSFNNLADDELLPQDYNSSIRRDRRSLRIEDAVNQVLNDVIRKRRIDVRPFDLYTAADVSRPTFYSHYRSCSDALSKYEAKLQAEFADFLTAHTRAESTFALLLIFINRRRAYFSSCLASQNIYMLTRFIRQSIMFAHITYHNRIAYFTSISAIEGIIYCWHEDGFNQTFIEPYAELIKDSIKEYSRLY